MNTTENTIKVWDPVVRLGHWTLVIAFFTAYLTEDDFLDLHVWAGYAVGAIVCLRLIWGFVGSRHARFKDFVRSPATILQYMGDLVAHRAQRFLGHNPAGGAMIIALLLSIAGTVSSGLVLYAIEEDAGPLAGWVADSSGPGDVSILIAGAFADSDSDDEATHADDARAEFWEETHDILANLALLLVALHIAGVLFSSYVHKENLVKSMFTGRKRSDPESVVDK
jgi:cytochrome b